MAIFCLPASIVAVSCLWAFLLAFTVLRASLVASAFLFKTFQNARQKWKWKNCKTQQVCEASSKNESGRVAKRSNSARLRSQNTSSSFILFLKCLLKETGSAARTPASGGGGRCALPPNPPPALYCQVRGRTSAAKTPAGVFLCLLLQPQQPQPQAEPQQQQQQQQQKWKNCKTQQVCEASSKNESGRVAKRSNSARLRSENTSFSFILFLKCLLKKTGSAARTPASGGEALRLAPPPQPPSSFILSGSGSHQRSQNTSGCMRVYFYVFFCNHNHNQKQNHNNNNNNIRVY